MKNVLITGASGYLGPYLCNQLHKMNQSAPGSLHITAVYNSHPINIDGIDSYKCDLLNIAEVERLFAEVKPDTVYHLASGTPTRIIDKEEKHVRLLNKNVTAHIAGLSSSHGALLIYTSTDLVYEGGVDLREFLAELNPLTVYAKTKLEGEEEVRKYASRHIILRTALVYGFTLSTYTSFFDTAYETLLNGGEIKAFTDQYRNPLYTEDAAQILAALPALYKENDIINFCGGEYLSRFDMCEKMCEIFDFPASLIVPGSSEEFRTYPMVKTLGLNNDKLKTYGLKTSTFRENLIKSLNHRPL